MRNSSWAVLVAWIVWSAMGCALSHHGIPLDASADRRLDAESGVVSDADVTDVPRTDVDVVVVDADSGCPTGTALCAGACVPTDTPDRCGSCTNDCTTRPGTLPGAQCVAGRCVLTCMPGLGDCDGNDANGCEEPLTSNAHCGACTMPCASPLMCVPMADAGTGRACGLTCTSPTTACGTSCADLATDRMNCGTCGHACPVPTNGSASCMGSTCGIVCNAGFHACAGACVSNSLPSSCGTTSCAPCPAVPNGTATCDGTSCGGVCDAGFHMCAGVGCVSNTATATCGASCTPCTPPPNSTATCNGTSCSFNCVTGFHLCAGACVSNSSVSSCGPTSCTACMTMPNFTATCDGTSCGGACNAGFHTCAGACVSNSSPSTCGSSCTACPLVVNGTATCNGTSCSTMCNAGLHLCAGACVSNSSVLTCGSSCSACMLVVNGTPTCDGTTCGFTCTAPYVPSGSMCVLPMPCGDRTLAGPEQCDDGNVTAGDGCSPTCRMEANTVVESCGSTFATITVTRGMQFYTGSTGTTNDGSGSCSAGGPESVMLLRFSVAGNYTIRLVPTGFDAYLRWGLGTCPGTGCENGGGGSGQAEQITGTVAAGAQIYVIADGPNGGSTGTFVLSVNLI